MTQIRWHRNGLNFNIMIGKETFPYKAESLEQAEEIEDLIYQTEQGDQYAENELKMRLSPGFQMESQGYIYKSFGRYYISGSNVPVDSTLASHISDFASKGYEVDSLINFAKLLYLNPLPHVRESLYEFINKNGIILTEQGHLVLYKSVKKLPDVDFGHFTEFIGSLLTKSMRDRMDPKDVHVYSLIKGEGRIFTYTYSEEELPEDGQEWDYLDTLKELYEQVPQRGNVNYTDFYSGKTGITLGKPVNMDWHECDTDPGHACSKGLHSGSFDYVGWYGGGEEKTILAVIVNPINITAVPESDKLRTCEYFPVATLNKREDGSFEEIEGNIWSSEYLSREAEQLRDLNQEIREDEDFYPESSQQKVKVINERLHEID